MQRALARFAQEHAALAQTLQEKSSDWPSLSWHTHMLRGVAGNLALIRLHYLLGELELAAQQRDPQPLPALLQAIEHTWEATRRSIARGPALRPAPPPAPAPTLPAPTLPAPAATLSAAQHELVLQSLDAALQTLAMGELPEVALQHLQAAWPEASLQAVHNALERFDFERASTLLLTLQNELPLPEGPPHAT